eukprot:1965595-Prymnesium_polylepis.1
MLLMRCNPPDLTLVRARVRVSLTASQHDKRESELLANVKLVRELLESDRAFERILDDMRSAQVRRARRRVTARDGA